MPRFILVPLAAALLASACSSVSAEVVARVHDEELSRPQLDAIIKGLRPEQPPGDAQVARDMIGLWVVVQTVQAQFTTDGIEITEAARADATSQLSAPDVFPGFDDLDPDLRTDLIDWQVTLNLAAEQGPTYAADALAQVEPWIKPRFGVMLSDGDVVPLGLPTAGQAPAA